MTTERRQIGRWWRRARRRGMAQLQGRTVAQYRRGEQKLIRQYCAFPQRVILGAEQQQLSALDRRWLRGEYPDASGKHYVYPSAQVRAVIDQLHALTSTPATAAERLSPPTADGRRQLLENGRAPRGGGERCERSVGPATG